MVKIVTQGAVGKTGGRSGAYKSAGKLRDGVVVLTPKSKPAHFTSREIKTTIKGIRRDSSTGEFIEGSGLKK